jgi:hypothetical protein
MKSEAILSAHDTLNAWKARQQTIDAEIEAQKSVVEQLRVEKDLAVAVDQEAAAQRATEEAAAQQRATQEAVDAAEEAEQQTEEVVVEHADQVNLGEPVALEHEEAEVSLSLFVCACTGVCLCVCEEGFNSSLRTLIEGFDLCTQATHLPPSSLVPSAAVFLVLCLLLCFSLSFRSQYVECASPEVCLPMRSRLQRLVDRYGRCAVEVLIRVKCVCVCVCVCGCDEFTGVRVVLGLPCPREIQL